MMEEQDNRSWNPYLAGALSGLVIIFSVALGGKYLGASTTFVRTAGMVEKLLAPERVSRLEYFLKEPPQIDWQWMFVVGIFLGSWLAARTGGEFRWQALPAMWESRFGPSRLKRALAGFSGGAIAMFGARLADG